MPFRRGIGMSDLASQGDYAGSVACVMAASLALGPVLVRLIRQPSMTRAIPLAAFLSAVICTVSAAYVQYASSYRMTVSLSGWLFPRLHLHFRHDLFIHWPA